MGEAFATSGQKGSSTADRDKAESKLMGSNMRVGQIKESGDPDNNFREFLVDLNEHNKVPQVPFEDEVQIKLMRVREVVISFTLKKGGSRRQLSRIGLDERVIRINQLV